MGTKQDLVERLATAAAGATEETQEERHTGSFQDSSPTRLDTAAFSRAAAEENTPVDSTMMRLAGDGNDNVCLDTVATTIAVAEEIRLVCFVAGTEAAGQDGTGDGVDTVATQDAAGETGTLYCSGRTENSTVVSNPINLIPIGLRSSDGHCVSVPCDECHSVEVKELFFVLFVVPHDALVSVWDQTRLCRSDRSKCRQVYVACQVLCTARRPRQSELEQTFDWLDNVVPSMLRLHFI